MEAIRLHGFSTLLGVAWIVGLFWMNQAVAVWLLPVAAALVLSIPLSVYSSRVSLGRAVRRCRLFLIPEELAPPQVIKSLQLGLTERQRHKWQPEGFVRAAIDPYANAVHVELLRGKRPKSPDARARNRSLREKMLKDGPASLTRSDRVYLLRDAESMRALYNGVWQMNDANFAIQHRLVKAGQTNGVNKDPTFRLTDRSSIREAHWQTT